MPPPVWDDGGWRVEVGAADQLRRFVFSDVGEAVSRRAAAVREPKIFIKVCAPVEEVAPLLPAGWNANQTGAVMTLDGAMTSSPADDRFKTEITHIGPVTFCVVRDRQGVEAGRGRTVRVDDHVIYDRIAVEPEFRRQGIGGRVMRALEDATGGPSQGVLTATKDGQALYRTLGWQDYSPYTTAFLEP